MKFKLSLLFCAIAAVLGNAVRASGAQVAADNTWPQFRGPGARGISTNTHLPDRWSATENVAWKTAIPGRGWSSPIVWGNRVYLTTAISAETPESPKKGLYLGGERPNDPKAEHSWKLLCLDLETGQALWVTRLHQGSPALPRHLKNSYASETPVTDGEHIYAYVGNVGVFCVDELGKLIWSTPQAPHRMQSGWGTASSPVLHGDRIYLVNDNQEHSYLLALDKRTGKEIWRVDREEKSNWSTPFVWETPDLPKIVTAGSGGVRAYSLEGQLVWWLKGMSTITIATPYDDSGLLYVSSGFVMDRSRPIYAVRPTAKGDISLTGDQTNNAGIAWCQPKAAPYNPSTLVYQGRLYVLYDMGLFSVFDAKTGAALYEREHLPEGLHFTASPWAYGNKVFCLNEDGVTFVLAAGDQFKLLQTNKLAEDDMCLATPALAGDRLLIRSASRLYCIRQK